MSRFADSEIESLRQQITELQRMPGLVLKAQGRRLLRDGIGSRSRYSS